MDFIATKHPVQGRGVPPTSFLETLVNWGRSASEEIFAPNPSPRDIYSAVKDELGPFEGRGPNYRRAVMLEVMRVHAGKESSWNQKEGVDRTNRTSVAHIEGQETGWFQVSFDSTFLGAHAMEPFARAHGIETPEKFIRAMKENADLALEYYARLVRVSIAWAGPLKRGEVNADLRRNAVAEFETLLS